MADTTRGYPYPAGTDDFDVPGDVQALAEAVDADVAAVEAAAGVAASGVASDLADHEAATTTVHGISDTSALVTTARQVIAGTGLTGGGTLAADRTLAVAYGTSAGTAAQGNDARLSDTRTPTDGTVSTAKIASGGLAPEAITGTAVVQARTITAGTGLTGGGDLSANRTLSLGAHKTSHAVGGSDVLTPGDIGAIYAGVTTTAVGVTWSRLTPVLTVSAAVTVTLPAASSNTAQLATIINIGTGSVAIARTGSDLIAGSLTSTTIPAAGSLRLVSDGTGWRVIDGRYTSAAVGIATYEWDHAAPGWRLIAYDSGWRDVTSALMAAAVAKWPNGAAWVRRVGSQVSWRFYGGTGSVAGAALTVMGTVPSGFSPVLTGSDRGVVGAALSAGSGLPSPHGVYSSGSGPTIATTAASADALLAWLQYDTATGTLPSSLPGTQVTAPV